LINSQDKKSWFFSMLIIIALIVASAVLIFVNWSRPYTIGEQLWSWLLALPIEIIIGYFWYRLFFSLFLSRIPGNISIITKKDRSFYVISISIVSVLIDQAYYELIWNETVNLTTMQIEIVPAASLVTQLFLILVPMVMFWLGNFALSYFFLDLGIKQAATLGMFMAIFTLSWLRLIIPFFPTVVGLIIILGIVLLAWLVVKHIDKVNNYIS